MNDLGGRTMSQETRDIYHRIRDFLAAAARELVEREQTALDNQIALHTAWIDDESRRASQEGRVQGGAQAAGEAPRDGAGGAARTIRSCRRSPAMLGKKSEADVDAAAMELHAPRPGSRRTARCGCATAAAARRSRRR